MHGDLHHITGKLQQMFFKTLATFAECESDLIRMRTREGMAVARAKGKLRGKQPKLSDRQSRELRRMYDTGDYSVSDLAEVFSVSRPTVYRTLQRQWPPNRDQENSHVPVKPVFRINPLSRFQRAAGARGHLPCVFSEKYLRKL